MLKNSGIRKNITIGRKKFFMIILWCIFIIAFVWSIYKNFTAINKHTIETKEVVETEVIDTSGMQSFLSEFINVYYTYNSDDSDGLSERKDKLSEYMTDDLIKLNDNLITADNSTSSKISSFNIWNIEKLKDHYYELTFNVVQNISKIEVAMNKEIITTKVGGKKVTKEVDKPVSKEINSTVSSTYSVDIYVDDKNNMVIIKNPTVDSVPQKSDYSFPEIVSDNSIDGDTKEEITEFLENFFGIYPTADELTLSYYVKNNALPVVNCNYEYIQLKTPVYRLVDDKYMAYIKVDYLNNDTGIHQYFQYYLQLEKNDKWVIIDNDYVGVIDEK